ncbi:uncharacterized protein BYT42DRAFT_565446 [Radiomyces spectabilis]|uniref:uncharacterized protein n=1 Tax=Radiomyces spectabilis TaxID=64574 RepID=UPI00221F3AEB|nr:uncharacterized protein BYT42DRAFT_565446 [Radiomyces spectabilis]KAI8381150.1 hypothetical protein BYT42DRAFT_565446 [Radiomyces spectabilis]
MKRSGTVELVKAGNISLKSSFLSCFTVADRMRQFVQDRQIEFRRLIIMRIRKGHLQFSMSVIRRWYFVMHSESYQAFGWACFFLFACFYRQPPQCFDGSQGNEFVGYSDDRSATMVGWNPGMSTVLPFLGFFRADIQGLNFSTGDHIGTPQSFIKHI